MAQRQDHEAHGAHDDTKPALVLGGTGSFGGAVARELASRGRAVRLMSRNAGRAKQVFADCPGIEIVAGDVQEAPQLHSAAQGCSLIVHGVNYPYDRWVPYMHTATLNVISAARKVGADVLFPGNVYGYGAQGPAPLTESAPVKPNSRKGRFRIRLEQTLAEATQNPTGEDENELAPIRVLVVRGGDYYGPTVRNELADWVFDRARQGKAQTVFGRMDVAHEWLFVPDLARAAVDLLAVRDKLAAFDVVNVPGHLADSKAAFCREVAEVAGNPGLKAKAMPWWQVQLFGLFNGPARELLEMRYLFDTTVCLDGSRLRELLPAFTPTPLDEAMRITLESYK